VSRWWKIYDASILLDDVLLLCYYTAVVVVYDDWYSVQSVINIDCTAAEAAAQEESSAQCAQLLQFAWFEEDHRRTLVHYDHACKIQPGPGPPSDRREWSGAAGRGERAGGSAPNGS
jgi:hypothetical protein